MQDTYISYVTDNSEQFSKALKVFLDKDNYPILVNCSMGKDRAGFLTAMLLTALDVPEETIMKDYMASNNHIDLRSLAYMARNLNTDAQETITVLLGANETWLDLAFHKIKKEYGFDRQISVERIASHGKRARYIKRYHTKLTGIQIICVPLSPL